jgi:transposase InsO family protein
MTRALKRALRRRSATLPTIGHMKTDGRLSRLPLEGSGCVDITYIPMRRGFLYLVAIMDWYSRKVLSWRLSNSMDAGSCVEALKEALAKYGPPEIFNSPSRALLRNTLPGS